MTPSAPFMAESSLPLGTKMLLYLDRFNPSGYDYIGSSKLTQPGIASQLGISRAHVALLISRANEKNHFIEKRLLHVPGHNRRVHCFFLTARGKEYARSLKDNGLGVAQ